MLWTRPNQDAWFDAIGKGNFDAAMHWSNGGATPYDMSSSRPALVAIANRRPLRDRWSRTPRDRA